MVISPKLISAAQVPLVQPKTKYMFGLSPLDLTVFLTPHPSSLLAHVDCTVLPTVKMRHLFSQTVAVYTEEMNNGYL